MPVREVPWTGGYRRTLAASELAALLTARPDLTLRQHALRAVKERVLAEDLPDIFAPDGGRRDGIGTVQSGARALDDGGLLVFASWIEREKE